LATQGCVTSDSFEGLRALLVPSEKRAPFADVERKRRHKTVTSIEFAGRWSLLRTPFASVLPFGRGQGSVSERPVTPSEEERAPAERVTGKETREREDAVEAFARVLLRRYGVMFRRLLEREAFSISWFELGRVYRRLEARGEIRGGHFISGVSGEQFALPEAIGLLRSLRKAKPNGELIALSAADPLNLVGILTPGPRITAIAANRILMRDGLPIAALEAGQIIALGNETGESDGAIEHALKVGTLPKALRPYYG
jgi:ATP-dependent Lhr-like helicase